MRSLIFRVLLLLSLAFILNLRPGLCQAQEVKAAGPDVEITDHTVSPAMPSRHGAIILKVPDFEAAREQVVRSLEEQGAELMDAKVEVDTKGRKHGWIRIQLPIDHLPAVLPQIRSVGKVYAERIDTGDNTSTYESLARRIETLQQHQERLASILTSERRLRGSDILYVQDRLFHAGTDEAALAQQRADIARGSHVCLLTISLFEPVPTRFLDKAQLDVAGHFANAREHAQAIIDRTRARIATAAAYAAVFAPIWVPLLLVGGTIIWLLLRRLIRLVRPLLRWVLVNRTYLLTEAIRRARIVGRAVYALLPEKFHHLLTSARDLPSPPAPLPQTVEGQGVRARISSPSAQPEE